MSKSLDVKRALISVSDKTGIIDFSKQLASLGVEIISTGGTAKTLSDVGISVTLVSDLTQFPEIMSGRVKTLHPKIHGGILGRRDVHQLDADNHAIQWIDLVVCNLYPFSETVASGADFSDCIEKIDIGGPSMIRAAAKNMDWVTVVHDPDDYDAVIQAINTKSLDISIRRKLAAKAFSHTAQYDSMIANYLNEEKMPTYLTLPFKKIMDCRYGENPHQEAAVYRNLLDREPCLLDAKLIQGKPLSYNNLNDATAALNTVQSFDQYQAACVVVKHANPCGVSIGDEINEAFTNAWEADSQSAFGGIVAINQTCTEEIAEFLTSVFIEVIIAPDFSDSALQIFAKKPNLRVLKQSSWQINRSSISPKWISGGLLWQTSDQSTFQSNDLKVVTKAKPSDEDLQAMAFAWPVLKHLKSNAVLIAKPNVTVGMGMGQVSRIDAVELALKKSSENFEGAILASDAFFPFTDSIERIAQTPIKAIVQPGGSIKDQAVIEACDKYGIAMVFTGQRCFNH